MEMYMKILNRTMLLIVSLVLVLSCVCVKNQKSVVGVNTVQTIENNGYVCENHDITTEDGYILTFQRIPHGKTKKESTQNLPILLMHGLLSSSVDWMFMGINNSLVYNLVDLGYDVWLGNVRGTPWSRNHTTLDILKDAKKFFDFSWHEIGYYDLPAAINHILKVTKRKALYYVGYSQGSTAFLVLGSTRPEYMKKIKLASLMVPASYRKHQTVAEIAQALKLKTDLEIYVTMLDIYETPFIEKIQKLLVALCSKPGSFQICLNVYRKLGGNDFPEEMKHKLPVLFSNFPTHAALRQLIHYSQLVINGGFSQFDHGTTRNKELYGTGTPPSYNVSKVSAPIAIYYSKFDHLVNYKDVQYMITQLPNVVYQYMVTENVGHVDMMNYQDLINSKDGKLIKTLQKYK